MRHTLWALAFAAAITFGGAGADETCWTTSEPSVRVYPTPVPPVPADLGGRYYIDVFVGLGPICDATCLPSFWIYEESNGLPGLQRDDEHQSDVAGCADGTKGDTVIF